MKPLIVSRLVMISPRLDGPGVGSASLYFAMAPHAMIRPWVRVGDKPVAPAAHRRHDVASLNSRSARLDHFTDRAAFECLADLKGGHVRLDVVHAAAHVRIDRHVEVAHQHLAVCKPGRRDLY